MEQFQLSDVLLKKIADLISVKNNTQLKKIVKDIHFADMAEIINELNENQGIYLIKLFDSEKTSEILTELDEDVREKILKALSSFNFYWNFIFIISNPKCETFTIPKNSSRFNDWIKF